MVLHGERVQGRYVLFATRAEGQPQLRRRQELDGAPDGSAHPRRTGSRCPTSSDRCSRCPGELPEDDDGWAYEMKWDGVRAVAYVDGGRVRLMSRNDLDITRSYPELAGLGEQLGSTPAVLDGELVAFDAGGAPDFGRLQQRMHVADPAAARRLARTVPVVYLVFDVLHLDGRSDHRPPVRRAPRACWKASGSPDRPGRRPPSFDGPGADVLAASRENRLEGVVAKRRSARLPPGQPLARLAQGQARPHAGGRDRGLAARQGRRVRTRSASLVLGVHEDGVLRPVGAVGTGFTDQMLDDLLARLRPLERPTSPFADDCPRRTSATSTGCARSSSARSPSPSGRATVGCATRHGAACGPTSPRTTFSERSEAACPTRRVRREPSRR